MLTPLGRNMMVEKMAKESKNNELTLKTQIPFNSIHVTLGKYGYKISMCLNGNPLSIITNERDLIQAGDTIKVEGFDGMLNVELSC